MEYSPRYSRFRALLRTVREEAGLSQAILAKKLGKPQSFVSKAEIGERFIDFVETLDFCAACDISAAKFIQRFEQESSGKKTAAKRKRRDPSRMKA